jgi:hypothetical protein
MDSVFAGWSKPATASISRPVTTTDIGDERSPATGCSARVALICGRRSGEALRTSQSRTLAVTASEACDREIAAPSLCARALRCVAVPLRETPTGRRPSTTVSTWVTSPAPPGSESKSDYLISAQAYALISSPTAISMMTGVFHFIAVFLDLILASGKSRVVRRRRRSGGRESRETAALRSGTARAVGNRPRCTGTGGIRTCRNGDPGQKRRTQDRRFCKERA